MIRIAGRLNPIVGDTCLDQTSLEQAHLELIQKRLADFKKAETYLAKELAQTPQCPLTSMGIQIFTTKQVSEAWGLSFNLGETLFYIKASKFSYMRKNSLELAMKFLRKEIRVFEGLTKKAKDKAETKGEL